MNVSESIDNFDASTNYSEKTIEHFDAGTNSSEKTIEHFDAVSVNSFEEPCKIKKHRDVKKEIIDKMMKRNYNEYKKKKSEVDKVYQEWIHPELNLFNTVHLNKCICRNCGKVKDINVTSKKENCYF